jgi:hypothetical protein
MSLIRDFHQERNKKNRVFYSKAKLSPDIEIIYPFQRNLPHLLKQLALQ